MSERTKEISAGYWNSRKNSEVVFLEDYLDALPEFQQRPAQMTETPGWIKCSDRLPPKGMLVFWFYPNGKTPDDRVVSGGSCGSANGPTHWMPRDLPKEPPVEEAESDLVKEIRRMREGWSKIDNDKIEKVLQIIKQYEAQKK